MSLRAHAVAAPDKGLGAKPRRMWLAHTVKQTGKQSRCQLIPQFRIVIVAAVKICIQYLQSVPRTLHRDFASKPTGSPRILWATAPKNENL